MPGRANLPAAEMAFLGVCMKTSIIYIYIIALDCKEKTGHIMWQINIKFISFLSDQYTLMHQFNG